MAKLPSKSRILIVDDQKINIDILKNILSDFDRRIALNGAQALKIAMSDLPPDLILLDIMMPDMDGYEVCRRLKENKKTRNIPVIFVTAKKEVTDEQLGFDLGAVDYVTKPINPSIIIRRVQIQLELKKYRDHLEDLVQIRTAELEASLDAAEAGNRAKSEFLASMSHEIRTPMNAVIGMTDLVLDSQLNQQQRCNLMIVQQSAISLMEMINGILDLSKLDAGHICLEHIPFDSVGQIENACETVVLKAHQKSIEMYVRISPDIPTTLIGDPLRFKQILINLINNAIKFTLRGYVFVRVELDDDVGNDGESVLLRVAVEDTGIGIPADKHDIIFERFTQADGSTTRKYGGTGLGLSICHHLVNMMDDGKIWLESEEGEGSIFHFTARFKVGQRAQHVIGGILEERSSVVGTKELNGVHILIGDPSPINHEIIVELLTFFGAKVTYCEDEISLLTVLDTSVATGNQFDCLLIDYHLLLNQIQNLPNLVNHSGLKRSPIVMTPINIAREKLQVVLQLVQGISISTPIRRFQLLKLVKRHLSGQYVDPNLVSGSHKPMQIVTTPLKILLVDDSVNNQVVGTSILEHVGHKVTVASDGSKALDILKNHYFDLILMDLHMPKIDGYECVRRIRINSENSSKHRIPIIAVTAYVYEEEEKKCLSSGMDGYLRRPYRAEELLQIIDPYVQAKPTKKKNSPTEDTEKVVENNYETVIDGTYRKRILLLQDPNDDRHSLETMLNGLPYNYDIVGNSNLLWEKVTDGTITYDLILLELLDSEKENIQIITQLRQLEFDKQKPKVPIIAITSHGDDDVFWQSEKNTPFLLITKPLRKQLLLDAIHDFCNQL
ncbi:MAG: response regulator [Magnetococcales bacterium]|nr:response regulator [Magnetococcales bacterium]